MKIVTETSLVDFGAWAGGSDTLETLKDNLTLSELERLEGQVNECLNLYDEGITEHTLNDFLWFERDTIAELLGYPNWEAFEKSADEEEDADD